MPLRYLGGEDRLVLWLQEKQDWMHKLDPIDFDDEELARIEAIWRAFTDLQKELADRFGYNRFYV
jgi:hypothetical protein